MTTATPKRPMTPFFLFREKEKEKGIAMGGKDAGDKWRDMTEEEKKPYYEAYRKAKEKFDAYLEEEGMPRRSSARKSTAAPPLSYKPARIRALLQLDDTIKEMSRAQYQALGRVAVSVRD